MTKQVNMQQLRDTKAYLEEINPVLLEGQIAFVIDTHKIKIGDGVRAFNSLPYLQIDLADIVGLTDGGGKIKAEYIPTLINIDELGNMVTIEPFTGATHNAEGMAGLVPAPQAGEEDYFLKGNGSWARVINEGGSGVEVYAFALSDVKNVYIEGTEGTVGKVKIRWADPDDVIFQGNVLARWAGTKLVRKVGAIPTDVTDGELVIDCNTKNKYANSDFEDTGVTNNTTYYYRFFPYTDKNVVTTGTCVNATPSDILKASLIIDDNTTISTTIGRTRDITITTNSDGEVTLLSSNEAVATAILAGNIITITGVAEGKATIIVSQTAGTELQAPDAKIINVEVGAYMVMTAKIDFSDSNPDTCVSYADNTTNMLAGSPKWDEFFGHYPVMLKNGFEGKKLSPTDFTKHADGTQADITTGVEGDVMIAFPRRGVKFEWEDENVLKISMTDNPNDDDFTYYAHTRGVKQRDTFYVGAYKGYLDGDNKLRSLSGKIVSSNTDVNNFRTFAQSNGTNYDLAAYYQMVFRQVMYVLKYKSLNSQVAVGMGYVAPANSAATATGGTDTKGMDYGDNDGVEQVKLFGIEDEWGNAPEFIDGIRLEGYGSQWGATIQALVKTDNFAEPISGAITITLDGMNTGDASFDNYYTKPSGTNELGFIINSRKAGSETTYFCDTAQAGNYAQSKLTPFSRRGSYNSNKATGMFDLGGQTGSTIYTARLMYL